MSYFGTDPGDLTPEEMFGREPVPARCELQGCKSKGAAKNAVGLFQAYDGKTPTMNRPALLCQACVDFAKQCACDEAMEHTARDAFVATRQREIDSRAARVQGENSQ